MDVIGATASHNHCVIVLKERGLPRWIEPEGRAEADIYHLPDDQKRPCCEHKLTA